MPSGAVDSIRPTNRLFTIGIRDDLEDIPASAPPSTQPPNRRRMQGEHSADWTPRVTNENLAESRGGRPASGYQASAKSTTATDIHPTSQCHTAK